MLSERVEPLKVNVWNVKEHILDNTTQTIKKNTTLEDIKTKKNEEFMLYKLLES